jgi:hypothetical protein
VSRHERKRCKTECARQMVRDGTRGVRQPAGGSRGCDTLRTAPRVYYVSKKKEKEGTERRTLGQRRRLAWQGGGAMVVPAPLRVLGVRESLKGG